MERFLAAASQLGITPDVRTFPKDTRTAQQAADALGCELGQIVKSLIFRAADDLVLVLTSGVNRVDQSRAAALFGVETLDKATADDARSATGFSIGGIPPCGHLSQLPTVIDEDLLRWDTVWAAAGAPDTVFEITPSRLVDVTSATPAIVS